MDCPTDETREHAAWCCKERQPPEVASDIQVNGSTLLLSQRAAKLFAPLMPENTEILPVEVENGENVCWIRPICLPHTLDVERSYCSGGPQFERPVLIVAQLTGAHLFCVRDIANPPVFSEQLVKLVQDAGLFGVTFREVALA